MTDVNQKEFMQRVDTYLDGFDKSVGPELGRVVYAILFRQVFKRIIKKHGMGTAAIMLRSVYRLFYVEELEQNQATAASVRQSTTGQNIKRPSPKDDSRSAPGNPAGPSPLPRTKLPPSK